MGSVKRFNRWEVPETGSLGGLFKPGEPRCGIYILEFGNGERYVGQAVDVVRRFADHRRHYDDILAVQFCPVDRANLNEAERHTVQLNEAAKYPLRNIQLVNHSFAPSPLDLEIDQPMQQSWLTDGVQAEANDARTLRALRRREMRPRYEKLLAHPLTEQVLDDLITYVSSSIIWPSHTVEERWSITAYPGTARCRGYQRLLTLNCGMVETFVVEEDRKTHDAWWFLNVDPTIANRKMLSLFRQRLYRVHNDYRSVGRVGTLDGMKVGTLAGLFSEVPEFERASRSLALALMRKMPAMFAKSHCDDLSDHVLCVLAETS